MFQAYRAGANVKLWVLNYSLPFPSFPLSHSIPLKLITLVSVGLALSFSTNSHVHGSLPLSENESNFYLTTVTWLSPVDKHIKQHTNPCFAHVHTNIARSINSSTVSMTTYMHAQ